MSVRAVVLAGVIVAAGRVFAAFVPLASQLDPRHLTLASVIVAVARIEIVQHGLQSRRGVRALNRLWEAVRRAAVSDREQSVDFGANASVQTAA
jgi:hypothetical protein